MQYYTNFAKESCIVKVGPGLWPALYPNPNLNPTWKSTLTFGKFSENGKIEADNINTMLIHKIHCKVS